MQTISKLLSSDALDDALSSRPNIKNTGASRSNPIIPMMYGRSAPVIFSLVLFVFFLVIRNTMPIPSPAPKYKYEAIIVGPIQRSSNLDNGILIAYSPAADIAKTIADTFLFIFITIAFAERKFPFRFVIAYIVSYFHEYFNRFTQSWGAFSLVCRCFHPIHAKHPFRKTGCLLIRHNFLL